MNQSFILNQLAEDREKYFNAVAPPVIQSSNFAYPTVDEFAAAVANEKNQPIYSRGNNPTVDMLAKKMAALEGAEDCLMVGSGAAAITDAVVSQVSAGDHIVSVKDPYSWATHLMTKILPRFSIETTFIDGTKLENFENACTDKTKLIYLESPNSWTFELQDLAAVADLAKQKGITTIIDNSYCTALCQRPINLGIDMVIYSATKYYNGHSDVVAGAICGSEEKITKIFHNEFMTFGNILAPQNAWLMLRSLRTLPIRLKQSSESTLKIIEFLENSPKIERIWYPFHQDNPQLDLARRQMKMPMGMFTIGLKNRDPRSIKNFCEALQYFLIAVSWGGHESLLMPKCAFVGEGDPQVNMIRFYVGLEEADVLIEDLERALPAGLMEQEIKQFSFDFYNEKAQIVGGASDDLKIKLGDFAGPLDLLLFLIKQEQANIFDIPIARITEKYLEYIRLMKHLDIAVAADFLVMAATLIEIKSKMLLPRDPTLTDEEEFEDPRKELVDRLLEYEKFKSAAGMLYERSTVEQAIFTRGPIESDDNNAEIDASVFDILTVFQKIMARHVDEIKMEIHREEVSLADMLKALKQRISEFGELSLLAFFEEMHSKRELVTAFIAVLEIVRTEGVKLLQSKTFGDIILKKVS